MESKEPCTLDCWLWISGLSTIGLFLYENELYYFTLIVFFILVCRKFFGEKTSGKSYWRKSRDEDNIQYDDPSLQNVLIDHGPQTRPLPLYPKIPQTQLQNKIQKTRRSLQKNLSHHFEEKHVLSHDESTFALSLQPGRNKYVSSETKASRKKTLEEILSHKCPSEYSRTYQVTWLIQPLPEVQTTDGINWETVEPMNVLQLTKAENARDYKVYFVPDCHVHLKSLTQFCHIDHFEKIKLPWDKISEHFIVQISPKDFSQTEVV